MLITFNGQRFDGLVTQSGLEGCRFEITSGLRFASEGRLSQFSRFRKVLRLRSA